LKCRPPSNRDPLPAEIEACAPYLREQVRLICPEVLVTLGNFATRFVLKTDRGITGLHGRTEQVGRFTVLPVYHPAATIYDRTKRQDLFDDFALLGRLVAGERVVDPECGLEPLA
jgi:DNA polymerase